MLCLEGAIWQPLFPPNGVVLFIHGRVCGLVETDQAAAEAPFPAASYSDRFARCMKNASGTLSAAVTAIR
jgi:hypothetical protein